VGDDQLRLGVGVHEAHEMVGDRREAATAVNEDRHAPVGGQGEHGCETLVVQEEALRARVQLDAAGAEVETARRLVDRILREIEANEGDEHAARAVGGGERAVVRGSKSRLAVGLVHTESEGVRDAVPCQKGHQLLVRRDEPVDVATDVDMSIEDLRPVGERLANLLAVFADQPAGALERFLHGA
jgi:hypothetical protein